MLLGLFPEKRSPITAKNIEIIPENENVNIKSLINKRYSDAGLVIPGFRDEQVKHDKEKVFQDYEDLGTILFVNTHNQTDIN